MASAPQDTVPLRRAASSMGPVVLASLPTTSVPPLCMVARAVPTLWAKAMLISVLARPLMPDEPKSLGFNAVSSLG